MTEIEKNMYRDLKKIRIKYKTHAQIVSSLSFGFWVNLAKLLIFGWEGHNIAQASYIEILDVSRIDFRKYDTKNHILYNNNLKLIFVVRLIQHIRNRAFHWENLLKIKKYSKKYYSNISAKENGQKIWILPKNTEKFLNDTLDCINVKIREEIINSQLA